MKNLIILFYFIFAVTSHLIAQTIMNIHQNNGTVLQIPISTIDSITYTNPNPGNLATITTLNISSITGSTAVSGGNISNNGGSLVTQRGVCWSTSPNPTTANNITNDGSGSGSYTSNLTGLTANTTYYVRAYAINSAGTAYGNELSFNTSGIVSNPGPGLTYNGYNYPTVILGNGQEWMSQNLRTTRYNDGTTIPLVTDQNQWAANYSNGTTLPMMCWYNNNQTTYLANNFGALYNWYAVNPSTNGNKNLCPAGWHVPTDVEWTIFINYLDPNADGGSTIPNTAGGKMKSVGLQFWQSPNTDATNDSNFLGLPGGYRSNNGTFGNVGYHGNWWSSSDNSIYGAWYRSLRWEEGNAVRDHENETLGKSIRCLKD
jgi:uncharacterized protein (TIGR02145 family)